MTIKEAEQQTGLTRSNIRYYEKEKLIEPLKSDSNGYKDYSREDVERIKKIAYLRTLGISVEEIRSVISQEVSLYEVVERQSVKLQEQITSFEKSKMMCDKMLQKKTLNFENLSIEEYIINVNDYWKDNKVLFRFDSVGFLSIWGSAMVWGRFVVLSVVLAVLSYSKLPPEIPVQWKDGIATSWVEKYFIFAFPIVCVLIRYIIRPMLYSKLKANTSFAEMKTEYVSNSLCFVALSVEVFTILFVVGFVKNIVVVLVAEAMILLGLLFIGMEKMRI